MPEQQPKKPYEFKAYPKMVYFEDGSNRVVNDEDEYSEAQGDGAKDSPADHGIIETEEKAARRTMADKPKQTVREHLGLSEDPRYKQGQADEMQRKHQAKVDEEARGREIAETSPAVGADYRNDAEATRHVGTKKR